MNSNRILILTNRAPYPFKDGGSLAMRAMIEGYHKAGWEVFLLAMNTKRHPVEENDLKKAYSHIPHIQTVIVDNSLKFFPAVSNFIFSKKPNHEKRFFHIEFAHKLEDIIRQFNPDVIQLESIYLATYLPYIKQNSNAITTLRLHNIEYQVWQRLADKTKNPFKKYFLNNLANRIKLFEERIWGKFDLLIPISESDAKVVKKQGINIPIVVAPYGIDSEDYPNCNVEEWNGYHIGAMDWLPNIDAIKWFIVSVWPQIHNLHSEFKFYYAGRNMPRTFMKDNPQGVICKGEVKDASAFVSDKKILIVPIHSGGGIRIKILEAMALGKLVISTDVGIQGLDAVPDRHYLKANTPDDFLNKISWALENKNEATRISEDARKFALEHYDSDKIMKNLIDNVIKMKKN
jgi:glycosyltransferase involved in cell wall biosynthesis